MSKYNKKFKRLSVAEYDLVQDISKLEYMFEVKRLGTRRTRSIDERYQRWSVGINAKVRNFEKFRDSRIVEANENCIKALFRVYRKL